MSTKLFKLLIFAAGGLVGAVISHVVTKKVVERMWWDECDRELNELNLKHKEDMKELREEIASLKESISQQTVTIQTYREKLERYEGHTEEASSENDDKESDRPADLRSEAAAFYRARYGGSEYEDEDDNPQEDDDYHEAEEAYVDQHRMERIDENLFDTTGLEYGKEELRYYIYDGKVLNEDGEWLDNYAELVGIDWIDGGKNGDVVYIRNYYYGTDYKITFIADFGEGHITFEGEGWED